MPTTRTRPKAAKAAASSTEQGTLNGVEILTLAEAAAYLRVPEDDVLRMQREQSLPGRQIGTEWRFLKTAIQDWLRTPPKPSSKEALLAMAGKFKDDPTLNYILEEASRLRGRPVG